MRSAVFNGKLDNQHREEQCLPNTSISSNKTATKKEQKTYKSLKGVKQQGQRLPNTPRDHDQQRDDKERNLDTAPHRHAHRQVELALASHQDRRSVLCRITHNRNDDQRYPLFRDGRIVFQQAFERVDEMISGKVYEHGDDSKEGTSGGEVQLEGFVAEG